MSSIPRSAILGGAAGRPPFRARRRGFWPADLGTGTGYVWLDRDSRSDRPQRPAVPDCPQLSNCRMARLHLALDKKITQKSAVNSSVTGQVGPKSQAKKKEINPNRIRLDLYVPSLSRIRILGSPAAELKYPPCDGSQKSWSCFCCNSSAHWIHFSS